jgi:hypothetical protein
MKFIREKPMPKNDLTAALLRIAEEHIAQGPGFAQEGVVIREAATRLGIAGDTMREQELLTCWHDLFREGKLSWGYDIDNPSSPFFHKPHRG